MPDGLRLALTTFTVAPVRGPRTVDRRTSGRAMELAPAMGLLLGLVAALLTYASRLLHEPPLVAAVVAIAALALMTRGLHLDGLADTVDGLASYRDPEGARAVMKAPDVGPLGVAAVVLLLLVQAAALQGCIDVGRGTGSLVVAVMTGRLAVTAACRRTPAATPDGLGAAVAGTVRRGVTTAWLVVLIGAGSAYAAVDPDSHGPALERAARVAVAVLLALGVTRLLRAHAVRRVGGLTGDVLGAITEVATTVCLLVLATGQATPG